MPTVTGAALANYTVKTVPGTLTITPAELTVTADDKTRAYGAANPVFTGRVDGALNDDAITGVFTSAATAATGVGTAAITAGVTAAPGVLANYTVKTVPGTLTITPAELTVTADDKTRAYGAANPVFTGKVTGQRTGDDITVTYGTTATAASAVGSYDIVPTVSGAALANYTVTPVNGTLTVTKADQVAVTIEAAATSGYYGDVIALTAGGGSGSGTISYTATGGSCTVDNAGKVLITKGAGDCLVTATRAGDGNHNSATSAAQRITVNAWTFGGFYSPVDMGGTPNSAKAGSTIPVKFEISKGTSELKDVAAVKSVGYKAVSCSTAPADEVEALATGNTSLRFDTTGDQFIYNWKTPAAGCYQLIVTAADGTQRTALFSLRK